MAESNVATDNVKQINIKYKEGHRMGNQELNKAHSARKPIRARANSNPEQIYRRQLLMRPRKNVTFSNHVEFCNKSISNKDSLRQRSKQKHRSQFKQELKNELKAELKRELRFEFLQCEKDWKTYAAVMPSQSEPGQKNLDSINGDPSVSDIQDELDNLRLTQEGGTPALTKES